MFRRYSHGHSVLLGVIIGLLIARHSALLALGSVGIGVLIGRTWGGARKAVTKAGGLVEERMRTERERRANVRAARRLKLERSRELRDLREERERKAYWRGAADAGKP